MSKTRRTQSTTQNTFSLLQIFKFVFFFGLLLTLARYANGNELSERERIEQEASERLGDALQPCIDYLDMRGECKFAETADACAQFPDLLALVPEDKQDYCEGLFKLSKGYSKIETGARHTASQRGKTVLDIQTKKSVTKPADFALAFNNADDLNNCKRFLSAAQECAENAGRPDSLLLCETAVGFFNQISERGQQACKEVTMQAHETIEANKQVFEEELAQTKFEL